MQFPLQEPIINHKQYILELYMHLFIEVVFTVHAEDLNNIWGPQLAILCFIHCHNHVGSLIWNTL